MLVDVLVVVACKPFWVLVGGYVFRSRRFLERKRLLRLRRFFLPLLAIFGDFGGFRGG